MSRESLATRSAQTGYHLLFGAKRHFATYEIVETVPAYFGIATTGLGIVLLAYQFPNWEKPFSVISIILGFAIWHLNSYHDKKKYEDTGKELTKLYYDTRVIYDKAKSNEDIDLNKLEEELKIINEKLNAQSTYQQVWGSGVFAHYKVFWECTPDWFVNELELTFWKDKVPASTKALMLLIILVIGAIVLCNLGVFNSLLACAGI